MARMRCSSPKSKFRRARTSRQKGWKGLIQWCGDSPECSCRLCCGAQSEQMHEVCQGGGLSGVPYLEEETDMTGIQGIRHRGAKRYPGDRLVERLNCVCILSAQHDAAVDMRGEIGIIGDKDHRPGLLLAAESSENCFPHRRRNIVQDSLEYKELRPAQNGPRDEDAYDVGGRENLSGVPDMSFQTLGQRIDFFFEFSKAKRPS